MSYLFATLLAAAAPVMTQPPLPPMISPQARTLLEPKMAEIADTTLPSVMPSMTEVRARADALQQSFGKKLLDRYDVSVADHEIAGVPVRIFTPKGTQYRKTGRILVNLHGGGFALDSGSYTENIPLAARTGVPVIAILYRLVPEHPHPAAVNDIVSVYKSLLGTHQPSDVGLYGTSAGAALTAQTLIRLKNEALPQPAFAGFFSGTADFAQPGDSEQYLPPIKGASVSRAFLVGKTDPLDTGLSPLRADLSGLPPILCLSGTRDPLLSATALFQRALLRAGVDSNLVVFEGMPHAHWGWLDIPETDEAFDVMASFFLRHWAAQGSTEGSDQ